MTEFKLVLGLEIHLHAKTTFKMFCGCDADIYGEPPNTHTCPRCLALPGALPVPNYEAIKKTQLLGLALNSKLNTASRFDRKHYFYPDLPAGYQISQYKQPLCEGGYLLLDSGKKAEIERIHLEEDVAKSFHENGKTLIDFNKSGMPLIEIVTKPIFDKVEDAVDFSKKIQELIIYLGVGDGDMEKGQLRLEANISLRTQEMENAGELPRYKVEIKNINSFKFMEKAVNYEITRQTDLLNKGDVVIQENRGWDEDKGVTLSQREKEEAHDYRYFPEPDIPPLYFAVDYIDKLKNELPQLPWERKKILIDMGLSLVSAATLASAVNSVLYKKFMDLMNGGLDPIGTANQLLNKKETRNIDIKEFSKLLEKRDTVDIEQIKVLVQQVINENQKVAQDVKAGKSKAVEFLVGQVMKKSQGKANAEEVKNFLKQSLH